MSRSWLLVGASLVIVLAATITSCDKPPGAPTPSPTPPQPPTATRLEITGPRSIVPGVPTQFTATMHLSDGSSRDVTASTSWRIMNRYFAQIDLLGPGLVSARGNALADLSAAYTGLTSTREVIAVPEGTFLLRGIVTDATPPAGPVSFALVEVADGRARGPFTFTGDDGRYVLLGVAGDIELRVTKDGYQPRVQRVMVADHQTLDVELAILRPLPDLSGSWVLTIAAADTCTALPAEATSRKYSAVLRQVGPDLSVRVSGATFATINGWIANLIERGRVAPDSVRFDLGGVGCHDYYYGCGPSIMEVLAPSRFYLPTGPVTLAISPTVLSGELNGDIAIYTGTQGNFSREASCRSSRHRLTFSK